MTSDLNWNKFQLMGCLLRNRNEFNTSETLCLQFHPQIIFICRYSSTPSFADFLHSFRYRITPIVFSVRMPEPVLVEYEKERNELTGRTPPDRALPRMTISGRTFS